MSTAVADLESATNLGPSSFNPITGVSVSSTTPRSNGPNPIIQVSRGPPTDPRFFYATTHSTYFRHIQSPLLLTPINGVHEADLKLKNQGKPRTGYSKNVVSFVEYDVNVDEGPEFSIKRPLVSRNTEDYRLPGRPKNYLDNPSAGLNSVVDSGFTRFPRFKVTDDGTNHKERQSQMKSCYIDGKLSFKDSNVDKGLIIPTVSAYISDAGEITTLGYPDEPQGRREVVEHHLIYKPLISPKPKSGNQKSTGDAIRDDGFSRSTRRQDPLKYDQIDALEASKVLDVEKLRHADLAEWVHHEDPLAKYSSSRVIHVPMDGLTSFKSVNRNNSVKVGIKEATGGVRNNPKFIFKEEPCPVERFATETNRQYQSPKVYAKKLNIKCDQLVKSGFSDVNHFKYIFPAKSDEQVYGALDPTAAKLLWMKEKSLHQQKPNRTHLGYTLKCE
ncbi:hypothetical protein HDU76_013383 [Blyttiomyces sp. JEL0837]|nr:hypothetical protein HDU76_013383 [Blyttiomyces sp. JEL0837]